MSRWLLHWSDTDYGLMSYMRFHFTFWPRVQSYQTSCLKFFKDTVFRFLVFEKHSIHKESYATCLIRILVKIKVKFHIWYQPHAKYLISVVTIYTSDLKFLITKMTDNLLYCWIMTPDLFILTFTTLRTYTHTCYIDYNIVLCIGRHLKHNFTQLRIFTLPITNTTVQ